MFPYRFLDERCADAELLVGFCVRIQADAGHIGGVSAPADVVVVAPPRLLLPPRFVVARLEELCGDDRLVLNVGHGIRRTRIVNVRLQVVGL